MPYDYELVLINQTFTKDEIGNQVPTENRTTILCDKKSAGRNEFYQAATAGLKPEIVFVIHAYEYNGEKVVEFEGKRYNVIRTYQVDFEELELTVERMVGGG